MANYVVAITGGIASGKSVFAEFLRAMGAGLIDADVVAREVVEPGTRALVEIAQRFGEGILREDGSLNRAALRERIFSTPEERHWLEQLLHPLIRSRMIELAENSTAPYVVAVIPLFAESGGRQAYPWVDRIAVVDVTEEIQTERLMHRDKTDAEMARKMIAAQATRSARMGIADDVVSNRGALSELERTSQCFDALYKKLALNEG